jgi:hypothetical protein
VSEPLDAEELALAYADAWESWAADEANAWEATAGDGLSSLIPRGENRPTGSEKPQATD